MFCKPLRTNLWLQGTPAVTLVWVGAGRAFRPKRQILRNFQDFHLETLESLLACLA